MKKTKLASLLSLFLATLLLLFSMTSCASKGKTLLTLKKDGIKATFSVNLYELMLSRMKGVLVSGGYTNNGVSASQDAFWDYQDKFNGSDLQTLNQYYGELILDNCRTYTAALWFFEKEGLSLSDAQMANVESRLEDALKDHGDGSKTKLNSVLAPFGINYNLLREVFIIEEKVSAVQDKKYGADASLVGPTVKDEYLAENYVHFKQIFLPYFRYVYQTDANGDTIYFVEASQTGTICYDKVNGFEGIKNDGTPITDKNGDTVYYKNQNYNELEKPAIAYDQKNGIPSYVLNDDGTAKTEDLTKAEKDALIQRADELYASLQNCSIAEFERKMAEENEKQDLEDTYTDGYYLQKNVDYAAAGTEFAYFSDIINAMASMKDGEITKITSDTAGYHIVVKYAPTEKAYEKEINEPWFKNFNSSLVEKLFLDECHTLFSEIILDEKVLASASDIKKIGANFYF